MYHQIIRSVQCRVNRTSDPDTHWPCWGWELEGFQGSGGWGWPEQPGGSVPACWARCCSSPQQRLKPSQTRPPSLLQVGWAAEGIEKIVQSTTRITFFFLKERNTLQKAAKSKSLVWMRPKKVSLCNLTAFNYCSFFFLAWQLWFRMWCLQAPWEVLTAASDWVTVLWKSLPSFLYIFFPRSPIKQDNF